MRKLVPLLLVISSCVSTKSTEVELNGSRSYSLYGVITRYEWKQVKGSKVALVNKDKVITNVFVNKGVYFFELTVWNNIGQWDKDTLKINNGRILNN